jgi:hypothetical protein
VILADPFDHPSGQIQRGAVLHEFTNIFRLHGPPFDPPGLPRPAADLPSPVVRPTLRGLRGMFLKFRKQNAGFPTTQNRAVYTNWFTPPIDRFDFLRRAIDDATFPPSFIALPCRSYRYRSLFAELNLPAGHPSNVKTRSPPIY